MATAAPRTLFNEITHKADKNPASGTNSPAKSTELRIPDSHYYDPYDRSTYNAEYAAKRRAQDIEKAGGPDSPAAARFAAPDHPSNPIIIPSSEFYDAADDLGDDARLPELGEFYRARRLMPPPSPHARLKTITAQR